MSRFRDVYAPSKLPGYPCESSPRFSTALVTVSSGAEQANRNWQHPLYSYRLPEAIRTHDVFEAIKDHWLVMGGPAHSWPFRDPLDFASLPLEIPNVPPPITMLDQVIGTGDGARTSWPLIKTYERAAYSYVRPIELPIVDSVLVSVNGVDVSGSNPWTVTRRGGVVTFTTPPTPGHVIRAGYLFDVEVRFEADDSLDGILVTRRVSGVADLTLIGIRSC